MEKKDWFDLQGKVAVMTGASGVIGSVAVRYFASQGVKMVLLGRPQSRDKNMRLVEEILADGGEACFLPTDILDKAVLEENCREIVSRYGGIDILLNAAGGNMPAATVPPDKTLFDLDVDAVRKVVDVNLFGTILPTMVFARAMVERGKGSIINFCSETSLRPLTRVAGYGVAKAAVANWTKYLAGELAIKFGDGLRVNAADRPEPLPADESRRFADRPFPQDPVPYAFRPLPGARGAAGNPALPRLRRFRGRHRHDLRRGRRFRCLYPLVP